MGHRPLHTQYVHRFGPVPHVSMSRAGGFEHTGPFEAVAYTQPNSGEV